MSITAPASMETLYNYVPSFGFNLIAVLAYSFVLAAHGFWFIKYQRTRWIQTHMLTFTVCQASLIFEAHRELSQHPVVLTRRLLGSLCILSACPATCTRTSRNSGSRSSSWACS